MISIIITAFNNDKYIDECLYSVVDSFKDEEYEILLGIDNCEVTTKHILKNYGGYSKNVKFYFFNQRYGTYIIRNTLVKEAKYDTLLFFDSDDIMLPVMSNSIIRYSKYFDLIKPMLSQFKDTYNINDPQLLTRKTTFGEGVFAIKKSVFLEANGFEPWICAADSEFNWRVRSSGKSIKLVDQVCFLYRRHSESLTNNKETNLRSRLRYQYHLMTNNKKSKNDYRPLDKMVTGNFTIISEYTDEDLEIVYKTGISDLSEIVLYRELKERSKNALNMVLGKTPGKVVESHRPDKYNRVADRSITDRLLNKSRIVLPNQIKTDSINQNGEVLRKPSNEIPKPQAKNNKDYKSANFVIGNKFHR